MTQMKNLCNRRNLRIQDLTPLRRKIKFLVPLPLYC